MHCNFVSTKLSIFALKHQFHAMTWQCCIWPDSNTQRKNCHTLYILIFCVVGRQMRDGRAYDCAAPRAYANRNPGLPVSQKSLLIMHRCHEIFVPHRTGVLSRILGVIQHPVFRQYLGLWTCRLTQTDRQIEFTALCIAPEITTNVIVCLGEREKSL